MRKNLEWTYTNPVDLHQEDDSVFGGRQLSHFRKSQFALSTNGTLKCVWVESIVPL